MKSRFEMTVMDLLIEYKSAREEFRAYVSSTLQEGLSSKDEVLIKRNEKEYERLQEECKDIACFIAERMIKNNLP